MPSQPFARAAVGATVGDAWKHHLMALVPNAVFLSVLLERWLQGLDGSKAVQYLSSGFEFPLRTQKTCETHTTENINALCTLLKAFACCWNSLRLMLPKEMEIDCKCGIFFLPLKFNSFVCWLRSLF